MDNQTTAVIIAETIKGATSRDIEAITGIDHSTIARARQKPDIKAKVEAGISQLINRGLKPAISTLCRAAAMGNTKSITSTPDLYKISVDASNRIISHISGSGPQTVINQLIYSQGTHAELSTDALAMVHRALGMSTDASQADDVIDLSPVDKPVDNLLIDGKNT